MSDVWTRSTGLQTGKKLNSEMKMSFLQWDLLDHNKLNMFLDLPVDQVQSQFKDILDLKNHQTCMKDAALLDYFVNGFWWAKEMNFTCQQISFILALLQQLLDNIKNKQSSFADHFKVFTQIINVSRKSSSASDASVLFDADQIRSITDYFRSSLFQHYRLYEQLFYQQRQQQLLTVEKCIEVVSPDEFISPLEEGMSADLYFQYVNPPRVQTPGQFMQERDESHEDHTDFSVEDVREMLEEMTREMLTQLQADFSEKLRVHEETYSSRLKQLQKVSLK